MDAGSAKMRFLAATLIWLYQKVASPLLPASCRFHPSCSEYARQAIEKFGMRRGLLVSGWRLLRCHPWSDGGIDPVP